MADVVIVANAYGADAIRRAGHRAFVAAVAQAGASGFEVRRELFAAERDAALGARLVKVQLGGFAGATHARDIAAAARGARARLLVENGQLARGGTLAQFTRLFAALRDEGAASLIGMTFDVGNWIWSGEVPLGAAAALAAHVEYIHCKAVTGEGARRFVVAPQPVDPLCGPVLAALPRHVPRGIKFPFETADLVADARRRVAWLEAV